MQRGLRDGNQISQMLARGEFRHDAAIFGVQFDLRGDDIGQNLAVAHDRGAGFVAGSFNGQQVMVAVKCVTGQISDWLNWQWFGKSVTD